MLLFAGVSQSATINVKYHSCGCSYQTFSENIQCLYKDKTKQVLQLGRTLDFKA